MSHAETQSTERVAARPFSAPPRLCARGIWLRPEAALGSSWTLWLRNLDSRPRSEPALDLIEGRGQALRGNAMHKRTGLGGLRAGFKPAPTRCLLGPVLNLGHLCFMCLFRISTFGFRICGLLTPKVARNPCWSDSLSVDFRTIRAGLEGKAPATANYFIPLAVRGYAFRGRAGMRFFRPNCALSSHSGGTHFRALREDARCAKRVLRDNAGIAASAGVWRAGCGA